jgi:glycosyltransferase involved in cell wall biosynthesis
VLWQSFDMQMASRPLPAALRGRLVSRYRHREEAAWRRFDAVVAINADELRYVRDNLPDDVHAFFAPMGIDLSMWPYSWEPVSPPRVAFYGSLASPHNQRHAALCALEVMPRVWARHPSAELWIVGSRPPERIQALATDPRITVTGFVEHVRPLLATMSAVVCPWEGRYGFRSRLVELMALGVPVVASADAVAGMDMRDGDELLLAESADELADGVMTLLEDEPLARAVSRRARGEVEVLFNNEDTYGRLARELCGWLEVRKHGGRAAAAAV